MLLFLLPLSECLLQWLSLIAISLVLLVFSTGTVLFIIAPRTKALVFTHIKAPLLLAKSELPLGPGLWVQGGRFPSTPHYSLRLPELPSGSLGTYPPLQNAITGSRRRALPG